MELFEQPEQNWSFLQADGQRRGQKTKELVREPELRHRGRYLRLQEEGAHKVSLCDSRSRALPEPLPRAADGRVRALRDVGVDTPLRGDDEHGCRGGREPRGGEVPRKGEEREGRQIGRAVV